MDAIDAAAGEDFDDLVGGRLEGLGLVAGPDGADGLAVDALVDAVGYGFDFGELGHALQYMGERLNTDCSDDTDSETGNISFLRDRGYRRGYTCFPNDEANISVCVYEFYCGSRFCAKPF